MSITFACGQCGKSFTVDDSLGGKTGRCKQCGGTMTIPFAGADAPAAPPDDVFGLEEPVLPPRASAPPSSLKPAATAAASGKSNRLGTTLDPFGSPSKSGKKPVTAMGVISKIFTGFGAVFVILMVGGRFVPAIRQVADPSIKSKAQLAAIFQKQVDLHNELAAIMGTIQDADQAKKVSPQAVAKIRAIATNLSALKVAKGFQRDLDQLKDEYQGPQTAAVQTMLAQLNRVAQIPDAMNALAIQGAFEELDKVEKSIPGLKQVELPPGFEHAPAAPPGGDASVATGEPPAAKASPKAGRPIMSKASIENLLKKGISLNDELAQMMAKIENADGAKAASVKVVRRIRDLTANVHRIKSVRSQPGVFKQLNEQYLPPLQAASQRVLDQVTRVAQIPDAWEALGAEQAFEELDAERTGNPGTKPSRDAKPPAPAADPAPTGANRDQAQGEPHGWPGTSRPRGRLALGRSPC